MLNKYIVIIFFLLHSVCHAATITVDKDGGRDHTTIQAAVNAASNGDTIDVYEGATPYYETVTVNGFATPGLIIQAATGESPVIDGQSTRNEGVVITSSYVTIDGFEIKSHTPGAGEGQVTIDSGSNNTIQNCNIHSGAGSGENADIFNNSSGDYQSYIGNTLSTSGAYGNIHHNAGSSDYALIQGNTITGGDCCVVTKNGSSYHTIERNYCYTSSGGSGAFYLRDGEQLIVRNNIFWNTSNHFGTIFLFDSENAGYPDEAHEIYNNTIVDCSSDRGAITLERGQDTKMKNNIFINAGTAVYLNDWSQPAYAAADNVFDYNYYYNTTMCSDTDSEGQTCAQMDGGNNTNADPKVNEAGNKPDPYFALSDNTVGDSGIDDDTDIPDDDYNQTARFGSQWIGAFENESCANCGVTIE